MEVKAIYDYTARKPDELSIKKGDVIKCVKTLEGGWSEGTLNGKIGFFPSNYVKQFGGPTSQFRDVGKTRTIARGSVKPINSQASSNWNPNTDNSVLNEVRKVQLRKVESAMSMPNTTIRKSFKAPRLSAATFTNTNDSNRQDFSKVNNFRPNISSPTVKSTSKSDRVRPKIPEFSSLQNKGPTFDRTAPTTSPASDKTTVINRFANIMTDHQRQTRPDYSAKAQTLHRPGVVNGANYPSKLAYNSSSNSNTLGAGIDKKNVQPSSNFGSRFQNSSGKTLNSSRPLGGPPPPPPPPPPPSAPILNPTSSTNMSTSRTKATSNMNTSKTKATSNLPGAGQDRNDLLDSIRGFKKDGLKKVSSSQGKKGQSNDIVKSLMKSKLLQRNLSHNRDEGKDDDRKGTAWS